MVDRELFVSNRVPLPIHGFVLAGGQSSRMGRDKATMLFRGRSLIEIAVEKLRVLCEDVSIAGNRDDLIDTALVVREHRANSGPAAGVEIGLGSSKQPWVLFIPVDVPLVPADLLRLWAEKALRERISVSCLGIVGCQPTFCLLQRERRTSFSALLDEGKRQLGQLLKFVAESDECAFRMFDENDLYGYPPCHDPDRAMLERWFSNLNTPDDVIRTQSQEQLKSQSLLS